MESGMAKWIEVPGGVLAADVLQPYRPGEINGLFDWAENPQGGSTHIIPHRGRLIVDVVEVEANAVHQISKPGDEIVTVLSGTLELTTDHDRRFDVIEQGETVFIPCGWAGIYRCKPGDGQHFRELAVVPGDYFDGNGPPPREVHPRKLDLAASADGRTTLHSDRYAIELESIAEAAGGAIRSSPEEVIQVLSGTLTLTAEGESAAIGPGGVVILPEGFAGEAAVSDGYCALITRWVKS
jgi:quercetin dioxygenase-like cupin family protein